MVENLVDLFSQLSREIIKHELGIGNEEFESKKKERAFNALVGRLRQKCFDILLLKYPAFAGTDPCKTNYGADWDPLILISDYEVELLRNGAEKISCRLITNIEVLQGKSFKCHREIYKLIFLLRGPVTLQDNELQHDFLRTVSEYSLISNGQFSAANSDIFGLGKNVSSSGSVSSINLLKLIKPRYEMSNIYSDNDLVSGKMSNHYLNSWSTGKIKNKPASSDFSIQMKSFSSSNFLQIASNLCSNDHSLWDNFVEKPLSHRPRRPTSCLEKTSFVTNGSGEHTNKKFESLSGLECSMSDNCLTELCDIGEEIKPISYEESFKKNGTNNGDLYPIVQEICLKPQSYESCFGRRDLEKNKCEDVPLTSFFRSSETLILTLWEQEHKMLYGYDEEMSFGIPKVRIMEVQQFLKDVQFLLVGIGTETFVFNDDKKLFNMKAGTCMEGVTPNTLLNFSKEFLDIGACFKQLTHFTIMNLKKQIVSSPQNCRIIFKAFWMSVFEYLCMHSQFVLRIPLKLGLLEFKSCVRKLHPMITSVAEICKVGESHNQLPQDGLLLSYLIRATQRITNKYEARVFFRFLKSCSEIYFLQFLQNWMFQGHLDRHRRDFFVEHRPKNPRCRDRSYYLSFYMFCDRVPFFLKGIEEAVFNCGKTIHLLKLIQPNSKFCRLLETREYPKMELCLSDEALSRHQTKFEEYAKNVKTICGQFASIASLRQEQIDRESLYEDFIIKVKREQETQRKCLQKESAEEMRCKRREQNNLLTEQIELAKKEKLKRKEEEEIQNKLFFEKLQNAENEEKKLLEEEKLHMKMYYQELIEEMDKRRSEAVMQKLCFEKKNKRNALMKNEDEAFDPANDSDIPKSDMAAVDREGNVIITNSALDFINSNVTGENLSMNLEDLENENLVHETRSDIQMKKLIITRREYENQIETTKATEAEEEGRVAETEARRNEIKLMSTEFEIGVNEHSIQIEQCKKVTELSEQKTDIQKNKRNVMVSEYGMKVGFDEPKEKVGAKVETEAQKNKRKIIGCEYGIEFEKRKESTFDNVVLTETEAEKNKKKVMGTEYGITFKKKDVLKSDLPETEAQKNKKKIMGMEEPAPSATTSKPETEAQKNKKKVMGSEYGITFEKKEVPKPDLPETEAQKNKKKIMGTEYGISSEVQLQDQLPADLQETEAQKNKKKVMAVEFGGPDSKLRKEAKAVSGIETEAQQSKRQLMPSEFGDGGESKEIRYSRAVTKEGEKNKQKCLAMEFGFEKKPESEKCSESQSFIPVPKTESINEESYLEFHRLHESTSFTEKSLQLYNKIKSSSDHMRFFVMQEKIPKLPFSHEGFPWFDRRDFPSLFDQDFPEKLLNADSQLIVNELSDMDVTKFTNYARKSVLVPLRIQEEIANKALFHHLLQEEKMLSHFDSLRNYFFLNDGEFSRRLTQNIFATLATCTEPHQFFKRRTLNGIVYEALNYTIHGNEPNAQNVSFEIVDMPPILCHSAHNVLSPFDLSYQVKWPLNIILTEKALNKYKQVFHFLLKLKRINWTLNENLSFLSYSYKDKRINSRVMLNSPHYHQIHIFRHAMGLFMLTLENYISACSLQFSWLNFQKDLETAKNLDHLHEKHFRYLKEVSRRCFLTKESNDLLESIKALIELSLKFHYSAKSGRWLLTRGKYLHTKFDVLNLTYLEFSSMIQTFLEKLRGKIKSSNDLKMHEILIQRFEIISSDSQWLR